MLSDVGCGSRSVDWVVAVDTVGTAEKRKRCVTCCALSNHGLSRSEHGVCCGVSVQLRRRSISIKAFGSPAGLAAALVASGRQGVAFLDSGLAVGGLGRFSFIAFDPFLKVVSREVDAFDLLRETWFRFRHGGGAAVAGLPFAGGAIGYLGYELGARWEGVLPGAPDELGLPEMAFGFYDGVIAHDHVSGETWLVANPVYRDGAEAILRRLHEAVFEAAGVGAGGEGRGGGGREEEEEGCCRI